MVTISCSGNSINIGNALSFCVSSGFYSLPLSGLNEQNDSIKLSRFALFVPSKIYGIVECVHQTFLHLFLDELMGSEEWTKKEHQDMRAVNFRL